MTAKFKTIKLSRRCNTDKRSNMYILKYFALYSADWWFSSKCHHFVEKSYFLTFSFMPMSFTLFHRVLAFDRLVPFCAACLRVQITRPRDTMIDTKATKAQPYAIIAKRVKHLFSKAIPAKKSLWHYTK